MGTFRPVFAVLLVLAAAGASPVAAPPAGAARPRAGAAGMPAGFSGVAPPNAAGLSTRAEPVTPRLYLPILRRPPSGSIPAHRIGVRVVAGTGEFYDRVTGARFIPRGSNYIRLAEQQLPCQEPGIVYHSTFNPGRYDPAAVSSALIRMRKEGYNVVRVFINHGCVVEPDGRLSAAYLDSVAGFLRIARANGIFALFAVDDTPWPGYRDRVPHFDRVDWPNRSFMTQEGIDAESRFWQDFIRALVARGAPLDAVFAYSLRNEAFFLNTAAPLSLTAGDVTTGNGRTYRLDDAADKQRMMDDNLVHWIDDVRAGILQADPTALVTAGFFVPQAPNPARPGDPRVIRTYPAIWQSTADFVDLHPYPGVGLTLPQYVENFEIDGFSRRPLLMGEFGAFRDAYPSVNTAAVALQTWQVESCRYGFDGWLLWTWDTGEQAELWNGLSDGGVLDNALAPGTRPDACARSSFPGENIALRKPAYASEALAGNPPAMAVDGSLETYWGSGAFAPQWIELDLQRPYSIAAVRLVTAQSPQGRTIHRLWGKDASSGYRLLHEFDGLTLDRQVLTFSPPTPLKGLQYLRIDSTSSPSWISWREIEVISAGP